MSSANYVSLSSATVLERSLDSTANNIANMSTTGFKASRPLLDSLPFDGSGGDGGEVSFVQDKGYYLDLSQGTLTRTENTLDVAISGPDWFSYEGPDGTTAYGRDGRLVLTVDGLLTTTTGAAILDAGGGRITLPADIGSQVTIARDGTIADQTGNALGRLGLFSISNPNALNPIGGGLYKDPGAAGIDVAQDSAVLQGFLEGSNVQATVEVTRLMEIQRAYERAIKVIDQTDELTRTAIQSISRSV